MIFEVKLASVYFVVHFIFNSAVEFGWPNIIPFYVLWTSILWSEYLTAFMAKQKFIFGPN